MSRLLLIALLLLPLPLAAEKIYRTVDEDGNIIFTDKPPSQESEPVELNPVTTIPAYKGENDNSGAREEEGDTRKQPAYEGIAIGYPTVDEAIRHNGGQVPFEVSLQPKDIALTEGHQVEIVVDGSVAGRGQPPIVTAGPIDRGPHDAFARIVDGGGNTLARSQSVNFFLLRKSIQQP